MFDGVDTRTVRAQQDLSVALGYSFRVKQVAVGVAGKHLSSELGNVKTATAWAGDVGLQLPLASRFTFGAALQNFGTKLVYAEEGDSLPRLARAGLVWKGPVKTITPTVFFDAPYWINEKEIRPQLGLELQSGAIFVRGGYRSKSSLENYSVGVGFRLSQIDLDYSFGFVQQYEARQRISFSYRFAPSSPNAKQLTAPAPADSGYSLSVNEDKTKP